MSVKYDVSIHGAAYGQRERMQEEGRNEKDEEKEEDTVRAR